MLGATVDVVAAVLATACIALAPGAALFAVLRLGRAVPALLRPAACVAGTIALTSVALVVTLAARWSLHATGIMVGGTTVVLTIVALLRWSPAPGPRRSVREAAWASAPYGLPALVLVVLGIFDSPHVRSDTYWHVALSRKLGAFDHLSSARLAFESGAAGNANYPLPTWHAIVAMADWAPRADLWSATWYLTLWMAPVAMLAFGGMEARLLGDRRAALAGCWTFVAVVVLGYGPYFFATRYLSYAGQVAIYLLLPLAVVACVGTVSTTGRARWAQVGVACGATVLVGVLHGNYVMYPLLFAGGGAVLLLLGARERWRAAFVTLGAATAVAGMTLAAQLPWINNDDNFARGKADPTGEPTAFIRHRDVFTGTEDSHHVVLGSLATQPMLVLGALALPLLLLAARRRPGPWFVTGGALAIFAFARTPQAIDLIDRLGTVTPATRFDRVYPAAVGVLAIAVAAGWLLRSAWKRGRGTGALVTAASLVAIGAAARWADSIRDTTRIVVTPFVEARWVGGLAPDGVPRTAVVASTAAIVVVALVVRMRVRDRGFDVVSDPRDGGGNDGRPTPGWPALASWVLVAVVAGLAPETVDRVRANHDVMSGPGSSGVPRIDVYPTRARAVISSLPDGAVVLAAFDDTRRIASLAPVYSAEESLLREISADPPEPGADAADRLDELVEAWHADYVAGSTGYGASNASFRAMLDAAAADPDHYEPISRGVFRMFRVRRDSVPRP